MGKFMHYDLAKEVDIVNGVMQDHAIDVFYGVGENNRNGEGNPNPYTLHKTTNARVGQYGNVAKVESGSARALAAALYRDAFFILDEMLTPTGDAA